MSSDNLSTARERVEIISIPEENEPLEDLSLNSILSTVQENSIVSSGQDNSIVQDNSVVQDSLIAQDNMPDPTTETLIAAARHYGEIIPKFEGKPHTLETFISKVDAYYDKYGNTNDDALTSYVFCMITNRLTGDANDFAICRPDLTDWPLLKVALRNKFGDFTDRKILAHQFKTLRIRAGETLNDFLERIKTVQTQLDVKIQMDDGIADDQKRVYKEINEQTALEVLYNNCPPMLQTILDVKMHTSLAQATGTVLNFIAKHPQEKIVRNLQPVSRSPFQAKPPALQDTARRNFPVYPSFHNRPPNNPNNSRPWHQITQKPTNSFMTRPNNHQNLQPSQRFQPTGHQTHQTHYGPQASAPTRTNFPISRPTPTTSGNVRQNQSSQSVFRNWQQPKSHINHMEMTSVPNDPNFPDSESEYVTGNYCDQFYGDLNEYEQEECDVNEINEMLMNTYVEQPAESSTEFSVLENFRVPASENK